MLSGAASRKLHDLVEFQSVNGKSGIARLRSWGWTVDIVVLLLDLPFNFSAFIGAFRVAMVNDLPVFAQFMRLM